MPEKTVALHIRVPEGLVQEIRKVARETNTPQGTALKYLIEQARNEQLETRLIRIEEEQKKLIKSNQKLMDLLLIIFPKLTSDIVHTKVLSLVNQRQLQQKLPLNEESFEDIYVSYLYKEGLKASQKQFEYLKHLDCGGYEWVVKEIDRLGLEKAEKKENKKQSKRKSDKRSQEHVK